MERTPRNLVRWLFAGESGPRDRFAPRWFFLRALSAFYFSAFLVLIFQIKGLIGPEGILPASHLFSAVAQNAASLRLWYVPSLFWLSTGSHWMMAVAWLGLLASIAAFVNAWPRLSFFVCFLCFLSFVSAAGDFSGYQS